MENNKSLKIKLFEVKSEIEPIVKDIQNTFFKSKYFDINKLLEHVEKELYKQRILLTQPILDNKVYSILEDLDSDEKRESYLELNPNTSPQNKGSEITYYRRYTLQSLLGLIAADDDGNAASGKQQPQQNHNQNQNNNSSNKKWLNPKDKEGKATNDWRVVWGKIQTGQYKNLDDIKKDYKVSDKTVTSINNAFEKHNNSKK
ncbi:ERF family protein [Empedobacter falsenii]|uniref:ERF family protein n=1 Tax=Empedobacter falsenii TaxID=343874 RepID=UPI003A80BA8F